MLARAHTFAVEGLDTRAITVEVDVRPGLPAFVIVGLAHAPVREARDRVRAAILNSGFDFPARRVTANLAPADMPKAGSGVDLALACALLAAGGQIPAERLRTHALVGELGLDGTVRPAPGALALAHAARRAGARALVVSSAQAHEAALVGGLHVAGVGSLRSAVRVLQGGEADPPPARSPGPGTRAPRGPDLADVRGQAHAVRALEIAAAGAHNLLLSGPPGAGKTMLALRLPGLLPPLDGEEALEVARIRAAAGLAAPGEGLVRERPFRAPHHTVTAAGLVGGARAGWLGEAVLAHDGVLFLDELSEFSVGALQALRQPLEEGRIAIARAGRRIVHPARFALVAATNPCPCGYAGDEGACSCSEAELARHRRRLSGPLLDRIDLLATMRRDRGPGAGEPAPPSRQVRERVRAARERQRARLAGGRARLNGEIDAAALAEHVRLDARSEELLARAGASGLLSARGRMRALRVARTIADLEGRERVRAEDVGAALAMRPEALVTGGAEGA